MKPVLDFEGTGHGPGVILDTEISGHENEVTLEKTYSELGVMLQAWRRMQTYCDQDGVNLSDGYVDDCPVEDVASHGTHLIDGESMGMPVVCGVKVNLLAEALQTMAEQTRFARQPVDLMLTDRQRLAPKRFLSQEEAMQKQDVLGFEEQLGVDANRYDAMAKDLLQNFKVSAGAYNHDIGI